MRTFNSLFLNYKTANSNLWYSFRNCNFFIKIILFPFVLFCTLIILVFQVLFFCLQFFDFIANFVDSIRKYLMWILIHTQNNCLLNFWNFIFTPFIVAIISPIFLLSILIPKFSSQIGIDNFTSSVLDELELSGIKTFKRLNTLCWKTASNMFFYIKSVPLILKPIVALYSVVSSIILIFLGVLFFPLIILDFITEIVEKIRLNLVNKTNKLAKNYKSNFLNIISNSLFLIFMVPLVLSFLFIPKITGSIDYEIN